MFTLLKQDGQARRGVLKTRHGEIQTSDFHGLVGTQATVKGMTPAQIEEVGAQIILGNTYHLNIRPGSELVAEMGGLHKFMNWKGPILTDSGGFQVFSLSKLRRSLKRASSFVRTSMGVSSFSALRIATKSRKTSIRISPWYTDECPPYPCERDECESAVARTIRWAGEFLQHATDDGFIESGHHVFGIIRARSTTICGSTAAKRSLKWIFRGYAIGGVSVG